MSDNTQDSGSSRRSFKARIPISASDATSSIKNGLTHLGDSISRGMESFKDRGTNLHGRMASRDSSVYSKGVRELDNYGYERYNIKDDSEIFISRLSDKALFNDGEPVLVRATEGNFVGSSDPFATNSEVKAESEPAPEDARSLFKNVPLSSQQSNTYVGVVGVNNGGHIEVTRPGFLDKMTRVSNVHPAPSIEVADDEGDDDHVIIESKPEETTKDYDSLMSRIVSAPRHEAADAVEEAVPETQVEAPVEEVQAEPAPVLNEDVFVGMPATERHEEFFIEAEPETEEPETLDCDSNVEVEDYDWFFEDDETEAQADVPVEETPVIEIEAPVEEVIEAVDETPEEIIEAVDEMSAEAPVEEIPVEDVAEVPAEAPVAEVIEAPVEADIEAVIEQEVAESVIDEAVVGAVIDEVVAAEAAKPAEGAASPPPTSSPAASRPLWPCRRWPPPVPPWQPGPDAPSTPRARLCPPWLTRLSPAPGPRGPPASSSATECWSASIRRSPRRGSRALWSEGPRLPGRGVRQCDGPRPRRHGADRPQARDRRAGADGRAGPMDAG